MGKTIIEGIYKGGIIQPLEKLKLADNARVEIVISKKTFKSLEGTGKQLVSDGELETFLMQVKNSLAK